jgi:glycosyltransferase involved in cell wall biosynthesis
MNALSISCLLVTHDRVAMARQAIRSFADQTWPHRELVIVSDGPVACRRALQDDVRAIGAAAVRVVEVDAPGQALGALRNLALASAQGDVVCQWDDDDCSHPERLARQLTVMVERGARASFLADHLQWLEPDRQVAWIDWTSGGRLRGQHAMAPGTLMMFRDRRFAYPESGPHARRGEDSAFLNALYREIPTTSIEGEGDLYLYRYHGANTFPESHHRRMSGFGLPRATLIERRARLQSALACYPVPRPVEVVGPDGVAFIVD